MTTCNYGNIQFQEYAIHRSLKTIIFKVIHTLVHRFCLVVNSILFVLHDCLNLIPIGAHNLPTHFLWEFGPFFFGNRLNLGQAGWFPDHHSGLQVLPYILKGFQVRTLSVPLQDADENFP